MVLCLNAFPAILGILITESKPNRLYYRLRGFKLLESVTKTMEKTVNHSNNDDVREREAPQLAALLKEIEEGLDAIRPIDKKQQYQIQKLIKVSENAAGSVIPSEKESVAPDKSEDVSKYRPNPDMLISKSDMTSQDGDGLYRPVKIAPTLMEQDRASKHERNALRREKEILRQAKQSDYIRSLMNDMEERPDEIRDFVGTSREVDRHIAKMEERARQEEELFTRVPLTKMEKKREKHLKKSRNGLQGLTESFYDEIKTLPFEDKSEEHMGSGNGSSINAKLKKRKRRH